jgi:hypothetical protein
MIDALSPIEATALTLQIERRGCTWEHKVIRELDGTVPLIQHEIKIISQKVKAAIAVGCGRTFQEALEFAYGSLLQDEASFCPSCGQL